jgi:hypothetical protein
MTQRKTNPKAMMAQALDHTDKPISNGIIQLQFKGVAGPILEPLEVETDQNGWFEIPIQRSGKLDLALIRDGYEYPMFQQMYMDDGIPKVEAKAQETEASAVIKEDSAISKEAFQKVALVSNVELSDEENKIWDQVRSRCSGISFTAYTDYLDENLSNDQCRSTQSQFDQHGVNAYGLLERMTDQFMYERLSDSAPSGFNMMEEVAKEKLPDWTIESHEDESCHFQSRLHTGAQRLKPILFCPIELIWSYWMEESLLMQAFNRIALRFQNRKSTVNGPDPLAHLTIDPLRPLNNLIWGFIQSEGKRLSLVRRAYEYDHHYGIQLNGTAVPDLHTADSRSQFLEEFHKLLKTAADYHRQSDDFNVSADPFPLKNAIYDVHIRLAEGAHNQFGDLPTVARKEMLMTQWVMARPEMREFLNGRLMVPQSQGWMDRVDHMKRIQGWPVIAMQHFLTLATAGEQLLVSIRYMNWANVNSSQFAGQWATYWREEIQGYLHAYRAVTGVDILSDKDAKLSANPSDLIYPQRAGA